MNEMKTAPKDGTSVLLMFSEVNDRLGRWMGVRAICKHPGIDADGFDPGWNLDAPVGYGGFPDKDFVGWLPLPVALDDALMDIANAEARIRGNEEYIADAQKLLREVSRVLDNGHALGFEQRYRIAEMIYQFLKGVQ